MGFQINEFIRAIAQKLNVLYPNYACYDEGIGQHGYDNCFYINVYQTSHRGQLGREYRRRYDFDLLFFPSDDSAEHYYDWCDKVMAAFEFLEVDNYPVATGEENMPPDLYQLIDMRCERVDETYHFLFAAEFNIVRPEEKNPMKRLFLDEELKG